MAEFTQNAVTLDVVPYAVGDDQPGRVVARCLVLAGGVQGLGVRPSIFRLATEIGLKGTVRNSHRGVEIEIEGPKLKVAHFEAGLPSALPSAACLTQVASDEITPFGWREFSIIPESHDGPLLTNVPADRAVCPQCLEEIRGSEDRRRGYAFTSCTLCGPRYTVIRSMPFERAETAMNQFPLCEDCLNEFRGPIDRRFHAQTICCLKCGPEVWEWIAGRNGRTRRFAAIDQAASHLAAGKIVALRGLGGYQLLVDAANEKAVTRLRERKERRSKPLAVMVKSTEAARKVTYLSDAEVAALSSPSGPIVLATVQAGHRLANSTNGHLGTVGLMLPTTPLHAILTEACDSPLVCTSANREGDPIEFEPRAAALKLDALPDVWIEHDREIVRPIDDSVVRIIADRPVTIRLARGMAPLSLNLPAMPPTIALGAFLKCAAAWSNGSQAVLGPHVGDQQSLASRERFVEHLSDMRKLYRFEAELLVHDMHPEYFSTQWAQTQGVRTLAVQHHHAHIAAGMLEQGWLDRKVLGVAWDGTGYGTDGTVWGGEFMISSATSFERVARLRQFRLPGGEAAIREPWRIAVSVCSQLANGADLSNWSGWNVTREQLELTSKVAERPQFSPLTSSAGRLIDAAAALILGIDRADYDGQAAMLLEAAADPNAEGCYEFPFVMGELCELDWRSLFADLLADHQRGVDPGVMAMRFHRSLAHGITSVCNYWSELPIILSGGVFQNRLLTELVLDARKAKQQPVGLPGIIPPNDGGIAAGQLAIAAARGGLIRCA